MENPHEVNFGTCCKSCCFFEFAETEDPCNHCLGEPINIGSQLPVDFKQEPEKPDILEVLKAYDAQRT